MHRRNHPSTRLMGIVATTVGAALVLSACAAPGTPGHASAPKIDFETATIAKLDALLDARRTSSVALAGAYVDRIRSVNTTGPSLRAVQSIVSDWKRQAAAADARRAAGESRGDLDGVPVIVKDNFDVKGQVTSAGSIALKDNVATSDSTVVKKLRDAGAVIIAKATMVEFAYWNGDTSWGYSSLGGQPLNPYDASFETSGSSSGPAVAAAAGLAAITFGTDTGGSVITPAERTSNVGYRPTTGMVSRTGIVPITTFSDTAGVLGRTVRDVAIGAAAIDGVDRSDPATAASAAHQDVDYAAHLTSRSLRGKRIGVVQPAGLSADQQKVWAASVSALRAQGATPVDVTLSMTAFPFDTTTYQFRENLDRYLATRTAKGFPYKSVQALADYYRKHPGTTQKYGASTLFAAADVDLTADRASSEAELASAQSDARTKVDALFAEQDLDALMFSDTSTVQLEAAIGSYPEVAVPAGYLASNRHPSSVVFMGARWSDADLLSTAYAFEQGTKARKSPSEINPTMWRCLGNDRPAGLCLP